MAIDVIEQVVRRIGGFRLVCQVHLDADAAQGPIKEPGRQTLSGDQRAPSISDHDVTDGVSGGVDDRVGRQIRVVDGRWRHRLDPELLPSLVEERVLSVAGFTPVTLIGMPSAANSTRNASTKPSTACLDAQYALRSGMALTAPIEDMAMKALPAPAQMRQSRLGAVDLAHRVDLEHLRELPDRVSPKLANRPTPAMVHQVSRRRSARPRHPPRR